VRLLADENVPAPSVAVLRAAGHDVAYVLEKRPGIPDPQVAAWGRDEARVVVTFDRDLGELLVRGRVLPPPGLVLLRFIPATPEHAGEVVGALAARTDLTLVGRLTVVDPRRCANARS
jgi:predicted nuclease of predicted toxin-antitoxin system